MKMELLLQLDKTLFKSKISRKKITEKTNWIFSLYSSHYGFKGSLIEVKLIVPVSTPQDEYRQLYHRRFNF